MTEWQQESQKNTHTQRKYLGRRKGDYKFTIPQEAELESDVKSSEREGWKMKTSNRTITVKMIKRKKG